MDRMKAYLDTCVVSDIHRDDSGNTADITRLLEIADTEPARLTLVTSRKAGDEIQKYKGKYRPGVERAYLLLAKVPFIEDQTLLGFHNHWGPMGGASCPMIEDDRIWLDLQRSGLDRDDAHHVMLAIRNACDVFVTWDRKSILRWRTQVESAYPIRLRTPTELVAELGE
jgi:predicted nucleic acid-binding protein